MLSAVNLNQSDNGSDCKELSPKDNCLVLNLPNTLDDDDALDQRPSPKGAQNNTDIQVKRIQTTDAD